MLKELAVGVVGVAGITAAQSTEPLPKPAVQYVVEAFDRHPLVAVGEMHGSRETMEFVAAVIRHSGFAGQVSDIVVEFGNARYQSLMDRYIAGGNVHDNDLRQVWEQTTQVSGVWSSPIYREFFADVRALNKTLPAAKQIRVLLGDPPIDWNAVTSPADEDMNDWRDTHFAWVVEREIMKKGRKALLFVGSGHISRKVTLPNSLIHLLDERFPRKTLVVSAIDVTRVKPTLASRIRAWPIPSAAKVRGTWLGSADVREIGFVFSRGRVEDDLDVVLYLTSDAFSNTPPRIDPASAFGRELRRRQQLHEDMLPFRGAKIRFAQGATAFTNESESALDVVLAELRRDHGLNLLIKAHADSTEPRAQEISEVRATFVLDWLVNNGICRDRLTSLGCGASRPLWYGDTEEHRAANRRAELVRMTKWSGCQPPASFNWE